MAESDPQRSSFVLEGDEAGREFPLGAVVIREDPEKEMIRQDFNRKAERGWRVSSHGGIERRVDRDREVTSEVNEDTGNVFHVMSRSNGIERRVLLGPDGHNVSFDFKVEDLRDKESLSFHADYETFCEKLPTSWSCEMFFKKAELNVRTPCIVFRLKRTDLASDAMQVRINLNVKDVTTRTMIDWREVQGDTVNSNEVVWKDFVEVFLIPEDAICFNMKLLVNVYISVYPCHDNNRPRSSRYEDEPRSSRYEDQPRSSRYEDQPRSSRYEDD